MNRYLVATLLTVLWLMLLETLVFSAAVYSFGFPRHGEQRPYIQPGSTTAEFWEVVQVYPGERVCVNKFIGLDWVILYRASWEAGDYVYIGAQNQVFTLTKDDPSSAVVTFDEMDSDGCVVFVSGDYPQAIEFFALVKPGSPPAFTVEAHPDSYTFTALLLYEGGIGFYILFGMFFALILGVACHVYDYLKRRNSKGPRSN